MNRSNRRRRGVMAIIAVSLAAGPVALVSAPGASAAKIGGGATTFAIDPMVADALQSNGVKLAPIAPAKAGGKGVAFPITSGDLTSGKAPRGHIDHTGGLKLSAGGTKVSLTDFRVVIGKKSRLVAKVGKGKLSVFSLDLSKAKIAQKGSNTVVSGVRAEMTKAAAGALNAAFKTDLFEKGLFLGKVTVKATPAEAALASGATTLVLDPGTASALTSLGITPSPVAPATAATGGLAFPITGGIVDTKTLAGQITHSGGLRLTKGSTVVDLTDFNIEIDSAPDLTALLGATRTSILNLDLSQAQPSVSGVSINVGNVKATLTAGAAQALNTAFSTTAFTPGLAIGTASVAATAK